MLQTFAVPTVAGNCDHLVGRDHISFFAVKAYEYSMEDVALDFEEIRRWQGERHITQLKLLVTSVVKQGGTGAALTLRENSLKDGGRLLV